MTGNALTSAPQRPISDRMVWLQENITVLGEVLNIMEEGMMPILSSVPELAGDTPKTSTGCALEAEIVCASERISELIDKVRSINSRNQL